MPIAASLKTSGNLVGWIVFVVLLLPILIFLNKVGTIDGFTPERLAVAAGEAAVVALAAWLLGRGLSRGAAALISAAAVIIVLILIAYAAAVWVLVFGLNFKIF